MKKVVIHEVGPRDGLQIEKAIVPTETKIAWIEKILESGVDLVQLGSFVNPERVPQMADTEKLFQYFTNPGRPRTRTVFSGLVLNEKGLDRGLACGVEYFCMGVSASETHSRKNTGMSTDEALSRILPMARRAIESGAKVQVSVQSAFGCGYEGPIADERVMRIIERYVDAGLAMISLADTAGHANPGHVAELFTKLRVMAPDAIYACHFHDTYGLGLANAYAAFRVGVESFDSAVAGLGGCPFTAITGGNISTEDLVHMFNRMNVRKDIELQPLIDAAKDAEKFLGRELPGKIHTTGPVPVHELATT